MQFKMGSKLLKKFNQKIIIDKKAQIGTTITWFVGFFIVFFVIILFLSGTMILAADKRIFEGRDEIKLVEQGSKLEMQRDLFDVLNSKTENGVLIKDFIESNFGTDDLFVRANIKIFDDGKELEEIDTESIEVGIGDIGKIISHWNAPSKGSYNALVEVDYGKVITLEKDFFVGEVFMNVDDVSLGEFELGDVVDVDIVLESEWNYVVEDVYADVVVKDKDGNKVNEFKTTSEDISDLSKGTLKGYWDTTGISSDVYEFVIKLNYAGKTSEEIVMVDIEQELRSMPLEFLRLNISVVLIAISLIILLIVGLLLFIRKNQKI